MQSIVSRKKTPDTNKYRSLLIMNLLLLVFFFFLYQVSPPEHLRKYTLKRQAGNNKETVRVYDDICVRQYFQCTEDTDSFEIYIGTINDDYHGAFEVELYKSDNQRIQQWHIDKLDIQSGQVGRDNWLFFFVENEALKQDKKYWIEITAPELDGLSAIYITTVPATGMDTDNTCFINEEDTDRIIAFSLYKRQTNWFFVVSIVILIAIANIWWIFRKRESILIYYLILLGTGLIMFLVMAPGSQPDEFYHYNSAYKLSNIILGEKINVNEAEKGMINGYQQHINSNESFMRLVTELGIAQSEDETGKDYLTRSDNLSQPIGYLAPAMGITMVRLLHGNQTQAYTTARLFNLISYMLMCMIAIRIIPHNKLLLLLICILPMALHQAVSTSRDVFANGMSLVFSAYIIKLISEKKPFTIKQVLTCVFLLGLFGPIKGTGCVLGLMILGIPAEQFKDRRDRIIKVSAVIIGTLAILLITEKDTIIKMLTASDFGGKTDYYHISFLVQHPLRYLRLILNSIGKSSLDHVEGAIGNKLAGFSITIRQYLVLLYGILILFASMNQDAKHSFLSRKQKISFICISLFGYLAIAVSFSFSDTPYGSTLIEGIQGRYLIPFAVPMLYGICTKKIVINIKKYRLLYFVWFIMLGYIMNIMNQIYI